MMKKYLILENHDPFEAIIYKIIVFILYIGMFKPQ